MPQAEASVVGPDGNPLVVIGPPQAPAAQPAAPAIGGMEDLGAAGVAGGVAAVQAGQEVAEGVMGGIAAAAAAAAGVQAVGAAQGALMEGVDFFLPPFLRRSVGGNGTGIAAALVEARPQNLRVLELRSCKLKGALLGHVCNGLGAGAWPVLEELRLSLGDLDAGAVRVLCRDGLGRMKGKGASLRVLELSGNEVRGRGVLCVWCLRHPRMRFTVRGCCFA